MRDAARISDRLGELDETLTVAAELVQRGRDAYSSDPAIRLAFEALANRVGDMCKRLVVEDPERFGEAIWSQAAKNRDFVVHHYFRIDENVLWETVRTSFPSLHERVTAERARDSTA